MSTIYKITKVTHSKIETFSSKGNRVEIKYETINAIPAIFELMIIFFRTVRSENCSFILPPQIYIRNG